MVPLLQSPGLSQQEEYEQSPVIAQGDGRGEAILLKCAPGQPGGPLVITLPHSRPVQAPSGAILS